MPPNRQPDESEMTEAEKAFNEWKKDHEQLAAIERAREIFYHGYLTRLLEMAPTDDWLGYSADDI